MSEVEKYIKSIPDFPQPGIIFRDVTSVTEDPEGMKLAIDEMDNLIATGGTIEAAAKLIESLGGIVVKMVFLIELTDLKGRERLSKYDVASVVQFEGE